VNHRATAVDPVAGAVLTGGASRRLGSDKATLDPYGLGMMLDVAIGALRGAGCGPLATVGGPRRTPGAADIVHVADRFPDQGPLGGIITALHWSPQDLVVVIACDMPFLEAAPIATMIEAITADRDAAVVLGQVDGREQPLTGVWRRTGALDILETAFEQGERAPRRVLPSLPHRLIDLTGTDAVVDIDSAADIDRYAAVAEQRRVQRVALEPRPGGS